MAVRVSAIVAMSENNCIGKDNDLPWHIPEDLKHFRRVTMGKPIIMGRKTFQSIVDRLGSPLPGRDNIVVSRGDYRAEGAIVCADLGGAIQTAEKLAAAKNLDEIIIGGGGEIFRLALPFTSRLYLTEVHMTVDGDAFFPELDESDWQETESRRYDGDPSFTIKMLERR